jgi:tripartite-type tricarboxylate transporter receptor subunit TctC
VSQFIRLRDEHYKHSEFARPLLPALIEASACERTYSTTYSTLREKTVRRFCFAIMLFMSGTTAPALAQKPVDYSGKTINFIVSFEVGGPYDLYGRLVARHIGRHLPGKPTVIVQNIPGAGGMVGINYLYNVAPKDGTAFGVVSQTVAIGQLLENAPGIKYDVRKATWIGRINSNVEVLHTWAISNFRSIDDARQREVVVAGTGPTSSSVVFPRLMNNLIKTRFRIVSGYRGPTSAQLALERGEVEAIVKPWSAIKVENAQLLRENKLFPILQYVTERNRELPKTPAVVELAETAEQRQIFTLFASGGSVGTSVLAPPGLSDDVARTLRTAFAAVMQDPAFQEEAKKTNIDTDPLPGEVLQKSVAEIFSIPASVVKHAKDASLK